MAAVVTPLPTPTIAATPSEIWDDILKGNVEKDNPLWKEYLNKAAVFDIRMVDEWNKIIDVLLVYVALFIGVLTSFIIKTSTQFQRNPADITNDLLVAIYNQLAAQSNNTSIPPLDPRSYFNQSEDDHDAAVIQNALLYTSLSLSITVSVIALVAKLWLVSYSHRVFSFGSPYDRAMKRQEAYNGVLEWNLGGMINMLPVILVIALILLEIHVYVSASAFQGIIGFTVAALLNVGLMFLGFTSLGGAFVPGCPFRSTFSSATRFFFEKLQTLLKWMLRRRLSSEWLQVLYFGTLALLWAAPNFAIGYVVITTRSWFSPFLFPVAISMAYFSQRQAGHKPQIYKISHLALWVFLSVSLLTTLTMWFAGLKSIPIYVAGGLGIFWAIWMFSKMSKSMADTGEIDAIAWLLKTTPQDPAAFFKKAGQMTGLDSIGYHYRPRLLESLIPFLTLLITSHQAPEHPSSAHSPSSSLSSDEDPHWKNLEIYVACLARLSEFTDNKGSFSCLWEDERQHAKLERPLIDKLAVLANLPQGSQVGLRSAATKVLINYELDMEGKPVRRPVTVMWSVATVLRSAASLMLNVNSHEDQGHPDLHRPVELSIRVEPHSFGEA